MFIVVQISIPNNLRQCYGTNSKREVHTKEFKNFRYDRMPKVYISYEV